MQFEGAMSEQVNAQGYCSVEGLADHSLHYELCYFGLFGNSCRKCQATKKGIMRGAQSSASEFSKHSGQTEQFPIIYLPYHANNYPFFRRVKKSNKPALSN